MRWRPILLALVFLATPAATVQAQGPLRGTVTRAVDGDTIVVKLSTGKSERVRLLAIDAPETGGCYTAQATAKVGQLARGKAVTLAADPTQDDRDRFGRLLAYATVAGKDLGQQLVQGAT